MSKVLIAGFVVVTLVAVGAIVAVSPAAYGQTPGVRRGELPPGSIFQMLRGGSELGVSIRDVEAGDVAKMKLPTEAGAVIEDLRSGGPAETAGMRKGDVVVEFDGEKVRSTAQLTRLVRETPAGRHVNATVIRDGRRTDVTVVPAETQALRMPFNSDDVRQSIERALPLSLRRGVLGVTTQELTPELASYFGTKDGVLLTSVAKDSPAEKGGMRVGDVVTEVAGKSISDARDVVREVQDHPGEIALKVVRDRKELTLKVTPETRTSDRQQLRGI